MGFVSVVVWGSFFFLGGGGEVRACVRKFLHC